jgi:hypothetical protein
LAGRFQQSHTHLYFNYNGTMKIHKTYIIGLAVILLGWSCREVYYPKEINSAEKIPVIQGIILEGEVPSATLSWALGYKDQIREYITGAHVYVTDDLGNSVDMEETVTGTYRALSYDFRGVQGRIYTLQVELPDGNEYASTPVLLPMNPFIDSIYADPGTRTVYTYNSHNEPVPQDEQGLYIMADLSSYSNNVLYYRFNTKVVKEMVYYVDIGSTASHSIFVWDTYTLDNNYAVDFTVTQNYRQVLREHPIGFLPYVYDVSLETPTSTAPYTVGWVLTFNVYSISIDVYNYYNSIARQLNSNNQLFAPVPSQVKSNIQCISDPSKDVIGVFEASSLTTIYRAFGWKSLNDYYVRDLSYFPDLIHGGSIPRFPPYFWIFF